MFSIVVLSVHYSLREETLYLHAQRHREAQSHREADQERER